PELQSLSAAFQSFRNKRYVNGLLAKKNDLSPNGEPFSMRKWTRWYVELVGPSLVFWNGNARQMLDADRIAHLKSVVMPNHINITDSSAVIVGTQKKRQCVFSLNTSGANRFYFQAESDLDMHIWIRGIRLACYEATKLYEAYSSRLL
ncbi:hypothetical protein GQ42DRAFT_113332, partial [Ramicandelaber brevisporus]